MVREMDTPPKKRKNNSKLMVGKLKDNPFLFEIIPLIFSGVPKMMGLGKGTFFQLPTWRHLNFFGGIAIWSLDSFVHQECLAYWNLGENIHMWSNVYYTTSFVHSLLFCQYDQTTRLLGEVFNLFTTSLNRPPPPGKNKHDWQENAPSMKMMKMHFLLQEKCTHPMKMHFL